MRWAMTVRGRSSSVGGGRSTGEARMPGWGHEPAPVFPQIPGAATGGAAVADDHDPGPDPRTDPERERSLYAARRGAGLRQLEADHARRQLARRLRGVVPTTGD